MDKRTEDASRLQAKLEKKGRPKSNSKSFVTKMNRMREAQKHGKIDLSARGSIKLDEGRGDAHPHAHSFLGRRQESLGKSNSNRKGRATQD